MRPDIKGQEEGIPNAVQTVRVGVGSRLAVWNRKIESLAGLEARGISRVLLEEKHAGGAVGYVQMFAMWSGISLSAVNLVIGFLGLQVF